MEGKLELRIIYDGILINFKTKLCISNLLMKKYIFIYYSH